MASKKNLKIVQLNVQGISNKINHLEVLTNLENPDILSIAEHWSSTSQIPSILLEGYILAAFYCRPTRRHGGTAIYVRSNHSFEKIKHVDKFSIELQCKLCAINLKINTRSFSIISVYRPPGEISNYLSIVFLVRLIIA